MDTGGTNAVGRAARVSLPYAGGFAVILAVIGFVPCCGLLVFPAGAALIAYLIAGNLGLMPTAENRTNTALQIGIGVGLTAMAALVIASLIDGLIGLLLGTAIQAAQGLRGSAVFGAATGVIGLVIQVVIALVGGAIFGIGFASLGAYLKFNQTKPQGYGGYERPF